MGFTKIDMDTWSRKECFTHFMTVAKSSYSMTVDMDVTRVVRYVKTNGLRFYPVFTWIVTKAINRQKEFRMGYDAQQNLGYYDNIHPDYAVLDRETNIMDSLCTEYRENLEAFYRAMTADMEHYEREKRHTDPIDNFFIVSCLPWVRYTSFMVSNESEYPFLFPMVTWGKYGAFGEKMMMPVTLQIHHAAADGYHCAKFYADVEEIMEQLT